MFCQDLYYIKKSKTKRMKTEYNCNFFSHKKERWISKLEIKKNNRQERKVTMEERKLDRKQRKK